MGRIGYLLVMLLAVTTPAFAQGGASAEPSLTPARLSAGGGFMIGLVPGEGGGTLPFAQVRVHLGAGMSAEVAAQFFHSLQGYYQLRVRSTPSRLSGLVSPYVTFGGIGAFETYRVNERRVTTPTGDLAVYPSYRHNRVTRPFALGGGGGATIHLPAGFSVDTGAELWFAFEGGGPLLAFQTSLVVPLWGRRR